MNKERLFRRSTILFLVLILTSIAFFHAAEAAPLSYDSIDNDTTWSSDQTLTTDVVVQSGASLTIEDITVTANAFDSGVPYGGGLSTNKIEVIVENRGELVVKPGAMLTAASGGDWYGVVFLPGSDGSVTDAAIRYGTVGVTIHGASPVISGTTIADTQGDDGPNWSSPGEMAAISSSCSVGLWAATISPCSSASNIEPKLARCADASSCSSSESTASRALARVASAWASASGVAGSR